MSEPGAEEWAALNAEARGLVRSMYEATPEEWPGIDRRSVAAAARLIEAQLPVSDREGAVKLHATVTYVFGEQALADGTEGERGGDAAP